MPDNQFRFQATAAELKENNCHEDRATVRTMEKQEGEIMQIDNVNFGIKAGAGSKPLLPCNLPEALQKPGKKIIFAGMVKEMKPEEMWAGQPFVLTEVEEK